MIVYFVVQTSHNILKCCDEYFDIHQSYIIIIFISLINTNNQSWRQHRGYVVIWYIIMVAQCWLNMFFSSSTETNTIITYFDIKSIYYKSYHMVNQVSRIASIHLTKPIKYIYFMCVEYLYINNNINNSSPTFYTNICVFIITNVS